MEDIHLLCYVQLNLLSFVPLLIYQLILTNADKMEELNAPYINFLKKFFDYQLNRYINLSQHLSKDKCSFLNIN